MVIEGTIVGVMETWPLQLSIVTGEGTVQVALQERTAIASGGQPADAAHLQPGRRVRVEGEPATAGAMLARRIELGAADD